MSPASSSRSRLRTLLLWAAPLGWLGCGGGGGTDIVLPSISVTTATDGVEVDPDGYTLVIDGSGTHAIGVAATLVVDQLSDGQHTVELEGMASNCATQGDNPQTVTVRSGSTTPVSFAVRCNATSGSLEVITSTTGSAADADGFTIMLDASTWGPVGAAATASVTGVPPGAHTIGLSGLAGNCQVNGENPREVVVAPGQTVQIPFDVTCADPGPAPGALTVSTSTTGSNPDPDGYGLSLDGGATQAIGVGASVTLPNVASGQHRVELVGVALNCSVAGSNPRAVTVAAGQTATVAFSVTCSAPAPGGGTLAVTTTTTGQDLDDAYTITVDGGGAQPIGANTTLSLSDVAAAEHQVRLQGIAANCSLAGANPVRVTVASGAVATAAFAVTCTAIPPQPGSLKVDVTTSGPSPDNSFTVSIDNGSALSLSGSRTIQNLNPGSHSVLLGEVAANCTVTGTNPQTITIVSGQTASAAFQVTCVAIAPSVNLRIQRISLSQSTQDAAGDLPLVEGRDGYLRVFATASGSSGVAPSVRVRFYRGSTVVQSFTILAPGATTPSEVQEGDLKSSWNVRIPGSVLEPNISVLADVDPENTVPETNENDNTYPASGKAQVLAVQSVPDLDLTFVPLRQAADGSVGAVGNPSQMLDLARRIHPLNRITTTLHAVFTVDGPLEPLDLNHQWSQAVTDLEALRLAENPDRTYVGMAKLSYGNGQVGSSFYTPGTATSVLTDNPADVSVTLAHELGHTFGQLHTPCGTPPAQDPGYPYSGGLIGVYGVDVGGGTLKPPTLPDIMGYCANPWISDYIYRKVMSYRRANPVRAAASPAQSAMLVWGHIMNGQAVLEPGFLIQARPRLPQAPGRYSVEARAPDGSRIFGFSFEPVATADDPSGGHHFVFAVPVDQAQAARLQTLRLTGPGIQAISLTKPAFQARLGVGSSAITAQPESGAVTLRWDARVNPMIMVRDPDTGQILSFARGGNARVWTGKAAVDLEVSNGVGSQRLRLDISR